MPYLMHRRTTLVVSERRPTRHGATKDVASVQNICGGRSTGAHTCGGERAEAQEDGAGGDTRGVGRRLELRLVVDVEGGIDAAAESSLHAHVVAVAGPGVIGLARETDQAKADGGVSEGSGEVIELGADLRVRHIGGGGRRGGVAVGDDMDIGVYDVEGIECLAFVFRVVGNSRLDCSGVLEVVLHWFSPRKE